MLAKMTPETNKWDTVLDIVEYSINNTLNATINKLEFVKRVSVMIC